MTQATDIKEVKEKVGVLERDVRQVKEDVSDVRKGVTVQMAKFDNELEALKQVVSNNTEAWTELRGTLNGINLSVKVLVGVVTLITPIIALLI